MQEVADRELLRQYVDRDCNEAFAALLTRHANMVYSVALRKSGSPQAAEEITQAVFIILARKARRLSEKTVLSGWLYHTARLTAMNFLRTEMRRSRREQEAYMQSLADEPEPEVWRRITPLLDDAMARLGGKDRDAIVLRFFEGKSFQEIASAAGASENAAKKRVHHALEKLRRYFAQHGVESSASAVAGAIASHSVNAAPVALVKAITAAAMVKGAVASASTLALVKATLNSLLWAKMKFAAGLGAGVLAVGAAVTLAVVDTDVLSSGAAQLVFSAQGTCRFTAFNSTGTQTTDYPFTVAVSNGLWFMRITDIQSNTVAGYFEIGCDGRRTYYVDYQEAWAQAAVLRRGTGNAENVAVGIIGPQEVPHFPFAHQAGAIWLAYASGRYFDAAASSRVQPAASLLVLFGRNVQPNSFALQQAFWSRRPERPGALASAAYLDDGIAGLRGGVPVKWPAPLDVGFTNAVYTALEFTNVGGLALPTRATLDTFSPQLGDPGPRVVRRCSYEIVATNLTTQFLHTGDFQPRLPGRTFVNDMRFSTSDNSLHVNYYVNDGRWLKDGEVKQLPEFAVAAGQASQKRIASNRPSGRASRPVVWVVFGLLAVLPVVFFYRQKRRGGQ
jgi:RNA polymerase sigma factor (sigma-70 family)